AYEVLVGERPDGGDLLERAPNGSPLVRLKPLESFREGQDLLVEDLHFLLDAALIPRRQKLSDPLSAPLKKGLARLMLPVDSVSPVASFSSPNPSAAIASWSGFSSST